jgi:hypothetical protein
MTDPRVSDNWLLGANNIAPADRLPPTTVRRADNVDATVGGKFMVRAGYEQVYAGTAVRGVLALGHKLLIADGTDLVEFNTQTNSSAVLRTIAGSGRFVGAVYAEVLYFCTENECLEYDGQEVRRWGVADVLAQPPVAAVAGGALRPGYYKIAITYSDVDGREGGTDNPLVMFVGEAGAISIDIPQPPTGHTANLYISSVNGSTLYRQASYTDAGTVVFGNVRDDLNRLRTIRKRAPSPADHIVSHKGVILMASRNTVWCTVPLSPHLVDRTKRFFQFPVEVGAMMATDDGVFVSADISYFLASVETDSPQQRNVVEFPAIPGTAVILPDGRGAWMTKYGQAVTNGATLALVNRENYAVGERTHGAATVVDHNGNQLIVTATSGGAGQAAIAASDYFFGEILNP